MLLVDNVIGVIARVNLYCQEKQMASQANTLKAVPKNKTTSYSVARKASPNYVKGRRDFFEYIDLGITDASNGKLRMQITKARQGISEPTGWHYHHCEGQIVYMTCGWLELEMADGKTIHLDEGDSIYIPGGLPHNEIQTSDNFELLEISLPAEMGTEPCDPPDFVTDHA